VYYFNAIDRIAAVDYVPSDQDILHCRVKVTGVAEMSFQVCLHFKPSASFACNYFAAPSCNLARCNQSNSKITYRLASSHIRSSIPVVNARSAKNGFTVSKTLRRCCSALI
jgi:hypothetical protein